MSKEEVRGSSEEMATKNAKIHKECDKLTYSRIRNLSFYWARVLFWRLCVATILLPSTFLVRYSSVLAAPGSSVLQKRETYLNRRMSKEEVRGSSEEMATKNAKIHKECDKLKYSRIRNLSFYWARVLFWRLCVATILLPSTFLVRYSSVLAAPGSSVLQKRETYLNRRMSNKECRRKKYEGRRKRWPQKTRKSTKSVTS